MLDNVRKRAVVFLIIFAFVSGGFCGAAIHTWLITDDNQVTNHIDEYIVGDTHFTFSMIDKYFVQFEAISKTKKYTTISLELLMFDNVELANIFYNFLNNHSGETIVIKYSLIYYRPHQTQYKKLVDYFIDER